MCQNFSSKMILEFFDADLDDKSHLLLFSLQQITVMNGILMSQVIGP